MSSYTDTLGCRLSAFGDAKVDDWTALSGAMEATVAVESAGEFLVLFELSSIGDCFDR